MKFTIAHFRAMSLEEIQKQYPTSTFTKDKRCLILDIEPTELIELSRRFGQIMVSPPDYGPYKGEWFVWLSRDGFGQK